MLVLPTEKRVGDASILRLRHRFCATGCLKEENHLMQFSEGYQEEYVQSMLLALVSMILEGPSIKDHMLDTTSVALPNAEVQKCQARASV